MKRLLDKTTTPPGGWGYKEPVTGVPFNGLSYPAIAGQVRRHRVAMELPVGGEWEQEFEHNMAVQNPRAPQEEIGFPARRFSADDVFKFVEVAKELLAGKPLVSEDEQERRASICAVCPKRGVVQCKFCGFLARELTYLMGGRRVPKAQEIFKHSCMACGCDLTAKTACPSGVLKEIDKRFGQAVDDYDENCWMRQL